MMKKLTAGLFVYICMALTAQSQNVKLQGSVIDTAANKPLFNAVISILQKSDSVLLGFVRTDRQGHFAFDHIKPGTFTMLITHHGFADYTDQIRIRDSGMLDLGKISLTLRSQLLQEVIVKQQIGAIRIKKDTLEFVADSFKLPPNASVEDLLKRFPGIQVDKNGKITAQGETVEKVLVEGEEFFGNDPTIATKNIQADAVDKVQIFDKKSDQATFTGIDDGQKSRTINLKLKDDRKKGYFGKLDLNGGPGDRWSNSGMFNRFRAKQKFSVYGIMSSTGKTGLDWGENSTYGTGNNLEYNDDLGGFIFSGNDDEFSNSNYYGEGLPKSWSTGMNYSNKFDLDKQNFTGSYRFTKLNSEGSGNSLSQSILPDTVFFNRESRQSFSTRQRHSGNAIYDLQIDSSTSFKLTGSGWLGNSSGYNTYTGTSLNAASDTVNQSTRNSNSTGINSNLHTIWLLRKKFKKTGRTISLDIDQLYNGSSQSGYLYSLNNFFEKLSTPALSTLTDQKKNNSTYTNSLNGKLSYTEPLSKKVFLEFDYGIRSTRNNAERTAFDRGADGKYDLFNDSFSNHYKFNVFTQTAGTAFRYNGKNLTFSLGSDIGFSHFKQNDLYADTMSYRNYTNFYPKANFVYRFGPNSRLNIGYSGNTQQPTIQQIQPVADNSDPLNITVGNAALRQEFKHSINFSYNSYKVFSQRGIYSYGYLSETQHAIVTSNYTDSLGRTVNQYINVNGNASGNMGFGYNIKLKKLDLNVNAGLNFSGSRYKNIVNSLNNTTDNISAGINIGLNKDKQKKYNIYYNASINYNSSTSSIRTDIKTQYWTQDHNFNFVLQLPWKLEFNTEVQANLRQKTAVFDKNNNVVLLNGYIGRKIFKGDKAMIKIIGRDILNQNQGYNRYINSNVLKEDNFQTIKRFFMIGFVWNFSKTPGAAPTP